MAAAERKRPKQTLGLQERRQTQREGANERTTWWKEGAGGRWRQTAKVLRNAPEERAEKQLSKGKRDT